MKVSAVILCGGKSRRMGTDKARLRIEGVPAAARLFQELSGDGDLIGDIWLSIGDGESYPEINARKISDRFPDCGPMAGLEAAMAVCREELLFVVPVDIPYADLQLAEELLAVFCSIEKQQHLDAVLVEDGNGRLQPLLGIYRTEVRDLLTERLKRGDRDSLKMRNLLKDLSVRIVAARELTDGARKTRSFNTPGELGELLERREPAVLSVTGWSGSGKTTWLEHLLPELTARGIRTAVIKHDAHDFEIDREGKDTWRMARAGAVITGILSSQKAARMEYRPVELMDFVESIRDVDLILLEGGSRTDLPKILVYRASLGKGMRVPPEECIAVISDDTAEKEAGCDNWFGFSETGRAADYLTERLRGRQNGAGNEA